MIRLGNTVLRGGNCTNPSQREPGAHGTESKRCSHGVPCSRTMTPPVREATSNEHSTNYFRMLPTISSTPSSNMIASNQEELRGHLDSATAGNWLTDFAWRRRSSWSTVDRVYSKLRQEEGVAFAARVCDCRIFRPLDGERAKTIMEEEFDKEGIRADLQIENV